MAHSTAKQHPLSSGLASVLETKLTNAEAFELNAQCEETMLLHIEGLTNAQHRNVPNVTFNAPM